MKKELFSDVVIVFVSIIFIFIFSLNLYSEKICDLSEVMKLEQLVVDNDYAYLEGKSKIHIYSVKNKKLVTSFGKKGEGPGEFPRKWPITINKNTISIDAMNKILFFSKMGKFIHEIKKNPKIRKVIPVADNYIGWELNFDTKKIEEGFIYKVYDENFKKIKKIDHNLYRGSLIQKLNNKNSKFDHFFPETNKAYYVYNQNIFMGDPGKGIYFEVFNHLGELVKTINGKFTPRKVTSAFKNKFMADQKKGKNWEVLKARKNFVFEKYFPCFERFCITNEHIFLRTYKKIDNNRELIITNMEGEIVKKIMVKDSPWELSSIWDKYFYYTIENEESETWELHRQKIF